MSKLIVQVCRIDDVQPHPGADRLAIATVKGWKTCIRHDPDTGASEFAVGDRCVFFPPDAVLPPALAEDRLGVMRYLQPLAKDGTGARPPGGRVRATRLRGVPSFGIVMPLTSDDPDWPVGTDVAGHFGVTKWQPPPETGGGESLPEHPRLPRYTEIENFGNFPDVFAAGEPVVLTEKIHGMNCRLGYVLDDDAEGGPAWTFMAGSHNVRRKETDDRGRGNVFWDRLTEPVRALLVAAAGRGQEPLRWEELFPATPQQARTGAVLFGELFGSGVQDMTYGLADGRRDLRAFDLAIDGRYVGRDALAAVCGRFGVAVVPELARGPFSPALLETHASGPTTMAEAVPGFGGREGVVARPVRERYSETLFGRAILKAVSADYLARKGGTDAK